MSTEPSTPSPLLGAAHLFDQYIHLIDDTARISDRRQVVNNYYVAANSILLGAVGLILGQYAADLLLGTSVVLVVALAGFLLCSVWRNIILAYRNLVGLRIKMLEHIESLPEFAGLVNTYQIEHVVLYGGSAPQTAATQVDAAFIAKAHNEAPALEARQIAQAKAKQSSRGLELSLTETHLPRTFQRIYVLSVLVMIVFAVARNYGAIVHQVALWGVQLPH